MRWRAIVDRVLSCGRIMSDDRHSEWYKKTGRRLPLWLVYLAAGVALIVLIVVLARLG